MTSSIRAVLPSATHDWKKEGATDTPKASDVIPVCALVAFMAMTLLMIMKKTMIMTRTERMTLIKMKMPI